MINSKSKVIKNINLSSPPPPFGLTESQTKDPIPLTFLDIEVEIQENYAKVSLSQRYSNPSDQVIDCSFNFPKTDGAVFYSLKVKQGESEIIGIIDSKVKVKKSFKKQKKAVVLVFKLKSEMIS